MLLLNKPHLQFSYWIAPFANKQAELMIAPHKLPEFYQMMKQMQIPYTVFIENVQALINIINNLINL